MRVILQGFLPEQHQHKVEEVRGQVMEEDHAELVRKQTALDRSVGVPQGVGQGMFIELRLSIFKTLTPCHSVLRRSHNIGVQDFRGSAKTRSIDHLIIGH